MHLVNHYPVYALVDDELKTIDWLIDYPSFHYKSEIGYVLPMETLIEDFKDTKKIL